MLLYANGAKTSRYGDTHCGPFNFFLGVEGDTCLSEGFNDVPNPDSNDGLYLNNYTGGGLSKAGVFLTTWGR